MIGQIIGGLFGGLFGGEHECVRSARDNIVGEVSAAFCRYNRRADEYEVGIIDSDGDRVALFGYETEGDADHAAGALARYYNVGIRG